MQNQDREVIRVLAAEYAAIANLPVHAERAKQWQQVNDLRRDVKPVTWINEEPWNELTASDDFLVLRCVDPFLRQIERRLRMELYRWRNFPLDLVFSPFLAVQKVVNFDDQCGMKIVEQTIGSDGGIVSHDYDTQFQTLDDIEKIKFIDIVYNEAETLRRYELLKECCGDIIEIKIVGVGHVSFTPWDKIAMWYHPNELLIDLILKPDLMHGIVSRYTDSMLHQLDQMDAQNLLSLTNNNQRIGSGGLGYASDLPGAEFDPQHIHPYNQWGNGMPQIFSEVGPDMHEEFALQYDRKWMLRFGLSYYGCCEPLHNKLEILKSVTNLRKISVSPWANLDKIVSETNGKYVLSIKPSPACFAEDKFNEKQVKENLKSLYQRSKGLPVEFIIKDISTCRNDVKRITRWCQLLNEVIGADFPS
jgi:hypothetical protein